MGKFGSIGIAISVLVMGWAMTSFALDPPWNWIVLGVGIVLALVSIALMLWPKTRRGTTYDITSLNQSGGITAGKVDISSEGKRDGEGSR